MSAKGTSWVGSALEQSCRRSTTAGEDSAGEVSADAQLNAFTQLSAFTPLACDAHCAL